MLIEIHTDTDELFDVLNIELVDVIEILVRGGHVRIPDYIETVDGRAN